MADDEPVEDEGGGRPYQQMTKKLILIAGGPGAGKTTYAAQLSRQFGGYVRSTDDLISLPWSQQSEQVAGWIVVPREQSAHIVSTAPDVIEGVRVLSGLRKAMSRVVPANLPIDRVIFLHGTWRGLTGQARILADRIAADWPALGAQLRLAGIVVEDRYQV